MVEKRSRGPAPWAGADPDERAVLDYRLKLTNERRFLPWMPDIPGTHGRSRRGYRNHNQARIVTGKHADVHL